MCFRKKRQCVQKQIREQWSMFKYLLTKTRDQREFKRLCHTVNVVGPSKMTLLALMPFDSPLSTVVGASQGR